MFPFYISMPYPLEDNSGRTVGWMTSEGPRYEGDPGSGPPFYRGTALALCGPSGCGKDAMGQWLGEHTGLRYGGSLSRFAASHVARRLGMTPDDFYERRRELPQARPLYDEIRREDPTALVRQALACSDLVIGMRVRSEFDAVRAAGLVDQIVWIERPGLPPDPTLQYTAADCDVVLHNPGTLEEFHRRIECWARFSRIPGRATGQTISSR